VEMQIPGWEAEPVQGPLTVLRAWREELVSEEVVSAGKARVKGRRARRVARNRMLSLYL
jgi:hypothetical protein